MAHGDLSFGQAQLDFRRKFQQADRVGHRGPILPYLLGYLLLGQMELIRQHLKGIGFFNRIQIFPLNVLD